MIFLLENGKKSESFFSLYGVWGTEGQSLVKNEYVVKIATILTRFWTKGLTIKQHAMPFRRKNCMLQKNRDINFTTKPEPALNFSLAALFLLGSFD